MQIKIIFQVIRKVYIYKYFNFDQYFQNYTIEVKQEVILQISVNSNPPSQISWEFNGEAVEGGNTEQLEDGSLKITEVSMENTGIWVVMANNDVESIMRKEIYLQVDPERTNITVCKMA